MHLKEVRIPNHTEHKSIARFLILLKAARRDLDSRAAVSRILASRFLLNSLPQPLFSHQHQESMEADFQALLIAGPDPLSEVKCLLA